jgi:hypothetical protein
MQICLAENGCEDNTRIYAVGAPAADHVWLYRGADRVGCLGGTPELGRALASGDVDNDGIDDLVVSDRFNVHVISGLALNKLKPTESTLCSLASLPEDGLLASFGCGSRGAIEGCDSSDFGASLAVGDLDGDGDGEVIVGAPQMKVRDAARAGAVLVYDADEGDDAHVLSDVLFLSSAEKDDRLGGSVSTARVDGRSVVLAGASGSGKAAVFFCSALLDEDDRGKRCQ